jgi:hypothetical protein
MKEASIGGTLWFAGWLFTIGFSHICPAHFNPQKQGDDHNFIQV